MEKLHILQFEYQHADTNIFLRVHNKFKHHYTGETMRLVQQDWIGTRGEALTRFVVFNEADFELAYSLRIKEPDDET